MYKNTDSHTGISIDKHTDSDLTFNRRTAVL